MGHRPLLSVMASPHFGASHQEDSPIHLQFSGLTPTGLLLDTCYAAAIGVHVGKPCFRGFPLMHSIHLPSPYKPEIILEKQQLSARHHASGEESRAIQSLSSMSTNG